MRQDFTTHTGTPSAATQLAATWLRRAIGLFGAALVGGLLISLAYQVPATHIVDIGGYDAAYTQGFYEPSRDDSSVVPTYLAGSDGHARWTNASSFLLFPQIGLPAELRLRLRGLNPQPVKIFLNGTIPLGTITPSVEWQTYRFEINHGLSKPSDLLIELRSTALTQLSPQDKRQVGILLDQAELQTNAWPIVPYPLPILLGAVASGLLAFLVRGTLSHWQGWAIGISLFTLAFLGLYRLQPLYPYPLRSLLPSIDLVLAALVGLRYGPLALRRQPRLLDLTACGTMAAWLVATFVQAQQHLVLSLPGVENDFRVFALRSAHFLGTFQPSGIYDRASDGVFRADGFYNLGYPLLLWLVRPFSADNPFLAARVVAALSGLVVLAATWWLARWLLGPAGGLIALLCLALSPLAASYGLYLGTDMPFAAACVLALALLIHACFAFSTSAKVGPAAIALLGAAGIAAGAAFLLRHPGLLLLPFGWIAIGLAFWQHSRTRSHVLQAREKRRQAVRYLQAACVFSCAFALMIAPQLYINLRDTGNLLFSQQAKNIWLAVYANSDWSQVGDVPNSTSLSDLVLRDPARFFGNWATNVRGFLGAGAENLAEFGRADQLRLLAFPANWLAIAALGSWLLSIVRAGNPNRPTRVQEESAAKLLVSSDRQHVLHLFVAWIALYMLGVSVGLSLLRFALPLMPLYAIAAAWAVCWLAQQLAGRCVRWPLLPARVLPMVALVLVLLLGNGFTIGSAFVLDNQNPNELAAVQLVQGRIGANGTLRMELPPRVLFDSYSAIAHHVVQPGQPAAFVLRQNSASAQPGEQSVGNAGGYTLYKLSSNP